MKKIFKYLVGMFTFLGGFISIFLATNKKAKKVKELKNKIKDGQDWKSNTQLDDISHGQCMLFKNYGIANPIFNFSKGWPKIGSHRMAFTSIVGSDVPLFFLLENDKEFVIKGMWPYFKN